MKKKKFFTIIEHCIEKVGDIYFYLFRLSKMENKK